MVFSSVPFYLDAHNWPQQHPGSIGENNYLPLSVPPLSTGESGGTGTIADLIKPSIRPGSMAERARLAKLPQPEAALKCPRCESTNTKFCYFNNYSLSQPRHFCKTCRRYWTRGGSLRSVPVGGGCRRNKRSKVRKRLKSPVTIDQPQAVASSSKSCCTTDMVGTLLLPPPQVPFLPSLPHLSDYAAGDIGSNFAGILLPAEATSGCNGGINLEFQMGSCSSAGEPVLSRFAEQWRLQQQEVQQFPILAGLEPQSRIYPFEGEGEGVDQIGSKQLDSGVTMKMEENQGFNLSRNFLSVQGSINDQYWASNYAWSNDLSGF